MTRALTLSIVLGVVGCGGSSADPTPEADTGTDPFGTTGASGTYGSRSEACARVATALNDRAAALGCKLAVTPSCPAIVDDLEQRAGVTGQCMEYDLGTVANCEARVASYTSCADFSKGCQLGLRASATASCTTADAGAETNDAAAEGG